MSKLAGKLQLYRWKMIEGVIISCYLLLKFCPLHLIPFRYRLL